MKRSIDDRCTTLIYDTSYSGDQLKSPYRSVPFNWNKIIDIVKNPIIASTLKHYNDDTITDKRIIIPLWSFFIEADTITKFRKDGKPSGCASNMKAFHCLQIDYDDGDVTMEEFIEEWEDYAFVLYSSPSYDGTKDKFRVVIPLLKGYAPKLFTYESTQNYMVNNVFRGCDVSTINSYRKQRVPAKFLLTNPYKYYINDIDNVYALPTDILSHLIDGEERLYRSRLTSDKPTGNMFTDPIHSLCGIDNAIMVAKNKLNEVDFSIKGKGVVNATMLKMNAMMYHAGVDAETRRSILYEHTQDADRRTSIDSMVDGIS